MNDTTTIENQEARSGSLERFVRRSPWPHCGLCGGAGGRDSETFPYDWIKCRCTDPEVVEKMARAIVAIEFNERQTWETCMDSARDRAYKQAQACLRIMQAPNEKGQR